jgi:aryl-alcohol dehydrogenase
MKITAAVVREPHGAFSLEEVDLWQQGRFPFDRLIRHHDFAQINEAVTDSEKGVTLKAVLRMPT